MVYWSCTPPSRRALSEPSAFRKNLNLASRTGPSALTKEGMSLSPPNVWCSGFGPTYGYAARLGLVPPTAGCEWQLEHELLLNRGPRPLLAAPRTTCSS